MFLFREKGIKKKKTVISWSALRKQISVYDYTGQTALQGLEGSSLLFKNKIVNILMGFIFSIDCILLQNPSCFTFLDASGQQQ